MEEGNHVKEQILVIRHGAIGDFLKVVGRMFAVRKRHPDAHIALLTQKWLFPVAEKMGIFDELIADSRRYDPKEWYYVCKTVLADRGFDIIYDLQGNSRTLHRYQRLARFLTKHPMRWGKYKSDEVVFTSTPAKLPFTFRRCTTETVPLPALPQDLSFLHGDRRNFDLLPEKFILLIPGCSAKNPQKRWPAERYREVTEHFGRQGIKSVVLGTAAESAEISAICRDNPHAVDFMGKCGLVDIPDLARRALVTVGNDTGPTHMIHWCGLKTVILFTDYDFGRAAAKETTSVNLHAQTIEGIPVATVIRMAEWLISPKPAPGGPRQVYLTCDWRYIEALQVVVYSLLKNALPDRKLDIYVAHDTLFPEKGCCDIMRKLVARFPFAEIFFIDSDKVFDSLSVRFTGGGLSPVIWAGPLLSLMLPETVRGNVVYLDVDMLICRDLEELYDWDFRGTGKFATATNEISRYYYDYLEDLEWPKEAGPYFNNGTMSIDLDAYRSQKAAEELIDWTVRHLDRAKCLDQDAQNAVLGTRTERVHAKWNYNDGWLRVAVSQGLFVNRLREKPVKDILEAILNPSIIHYMNRKPWRFTHRPERLIYHAYMKELGIFDPRLDGVNAKERLELKFYNVANALMKKLVKAVYTIRFGKLPAE